MMEFLIGFVGIEKTSTMTSSIIVAWTGSVCVSVGGRERAWDIIPDDIGSTVRILRTK